MAFRFSDLLDLGKDSGDNINTDELECALPDTPDYIIENVYSHHGRKSEFQSQYGKVIISEVSWVKTELSADEILRCGHYGGFTRWVESVQSRLRSFETSGWPCIDLRNEIVEHWKEYRTWASPPIALQRSVIGKGDGLWLVEGHTRLGVLKGLVGRGIVDGNSRHEIWVGYQSHGTAT